MAQYWLFKTEPDEYSIDDLKQEGQCAWEGIRNYQARNRLRDEVSEGALVFIHHSSCKTPAIVGLARVIRNAYPDASQFDTDSPYFDAKSEQENPRWLAVDIAYAEHAKTALTLKEIKNSKALSSLELVTHPRLSIQKVDRKHAEILLKSIGVHPVT